MANLILITIDCLRQDFLHLNTNLTFEEFQRIFDEGMSFINIISAGANTPLAFPSLFSSSYPSMYGGYNCLSQSRLTLAEVLKANGYATAGFHSNPHLISQFNYNRGFSYFYDYDNSQKSRASKFVGGFRRRYKERYGHKKIIRNIVDLLSDSRLLNALAHKYIVDKKPYDDARTINARAIKWLIDGRNRRDQFFLWLHYMEPHTPYEIYDCTEELCNTKNIYQSTATSLFLKGKQEPENITEFDADMLRFLYLTQIKYLDLRLKEFFEFLSRKGFLENTVIMVTADHGEEFFEHGLFAHAAGAHQRNRDIYLFNTVLRIPLLIYGVGIEAGENENLASTIDIAPTVCSLLGVECPKQWLGQNVLSKDFEREIVVSEQVYLEENKISGAYAFQTRDEKFIYNTYDQSHQYYRLDEDPGETKNQINAYPEKIAQIDQLYSAHQKMVLETQEEPPEHPEIDQEIARRLRDLGYM